MPVLIALLKVVHVLNAMLMVWPFYALVAVNQRARLGPPLGDRTDSYMENIIKNRTIPCFVFQATALISGLALLFLQGNGVEALFQNPSLGVKFLLLFFIAGMLSYVHTALQPQIDALFAQAGSNQVPAELGQKIAALRLRRKRVAATCLFSVLTAAMLGVQVWAPFPLWLSGLLVLAIAAFTWKAYMSVTPYGWV